MEAGGWLGVGGCGWVAGGRRRRRGGGVVVRTGVGLLPGCSLRVLLAPLRGSSAMFQKHGVRRFSELACGSPQACILPREVGKCSFRRHLACIFCPTASAPRCVWPILWLPAVKFEPTFSIFFSNVISYVLVQFFRN